MADLAAAGTAGGGLLGPLARTQYGALARLRWDMFSNSLRTHKGGLELGARTFSYLVYGCIGLALGAGAGFAAYFLAADNEWRFLPIVFWVLTLIWQMIPIMLASFQEQFDLGMILRFPVRFGSYYLLYLVFGLLDISTILGGLCCFGILIGMGVVRPALLPFAALGLAVFAAFNILLVRAIFAWIERWLAQRRSREILGAVFMVCILGMQMLNPALYQKGHGHRGSSQQQAEQLLAARERYLPVLRKVNAIQQWLPPGLAAQSLRLSAERAPGASLAAMVVLGFYGVVVGSVLAVRLKAEYRGESLSIAPGRQAAALRSRAAPGPGPGPAAAAGALAVGMPARSSAMAALVEKDVRAMVRTLPLLWAVGAPLVMMVIFSGTVLKNMGTHAMAFPFALPLCLVYAQLGFTQIFYNSLGTEGAGMQLYFLSPTPFRTVMLAKNLLHSVLFVLVAGLAMEMAVLRLGTPDAAVLAATLAWLVFALPCHLTAGNLFSLKMPYRVNPGRISRQRGSQANALLSLLVQIGFLAIGAFVFWLAWMMDRMVLAAPIFLALGVGAWLVWKQVLDTLDTVAYERRTALMTTLMKEG